VVIVLQRRNGPRRLRDHDDYLFEVAVCPTCCRSSVLRRIFAGGPAAGHTYTQFLKAQCVAADPAGVGRTGAQSTACIYGYAQSACLHGETDHRLLIDYYKTNTDYEKKTEFNIPKNNLQIWHKYKFSLSILQICYIVKSTGTCQTMST